MKQYILCALCAVLWSSSYAQFPTQKQLDSLSDEALLDLFDEVQYDSIQAEQVARVYLDRARSSQDTIKMARGYDRLARIFHPEKNLMFADSIIVLTENFQNKTYPGIGYILKGLAYSQLKNLKASSDEFIKAMNQSGITKNLQQEVFVLDQLIFMKTIWGNKKEALELQNERHNIIIESAYSDNIKAASRKNVKLNLQQILADDLVSSHEIYAFVYMHLEQYDESFSHLAKAKNLLLDLNNQRRVYHSTFIDELSMELNYRVGKVSRINL